MTIKNINTDLEERLNQIKHEVLNHMNCDHADANLTYVRALAGLPEATSARITDLDQFGISLLAETSNGWSKIQLPFLKPLKKCDDIRSALIKLLQHARSKL
tara:strand:+ start:432 stop:737 length:306 start_codon:yes stop_codon:yes gene_type:complete